MDIKQAEQLYLQARQRLFAGDKSPQVREMLQQALAAAQQLNDQQLVGLIDNDLKQQFGVGSVAQQLMQSYLQATAPAPTTYSPMVQRMIDRRSGEPLRNPGYNGVDRRRP